MNNKTRYLTTEEPRINCSSILKKKFNSKFWEFLHSIWKIFVKKLLLDSNELQVWQKVDRYGNTYWQAYDPATGKSFSSGSQADVCMWIEQLYRY
ncbi:hypothetical protein [Nostoc sp. FACHB-892]|uniref:hypothetical protein n=1 Tax=Nostoc sp. FACHB-892 TaxID=2692843 RepID=UPI001F54D406|nr:hypothetical protein [Nostoc sp. FACHB-892]